MHSVLLDMGLATYYGGDNTVRIIAMMNVDRIDPIHSATLELIAESRNPSLIINHSINSLLSNK